MARLAVCTAPVLFLAGAFSISAAGSSSIVNAPNPPASQPVVLPISVTDASGHPIPHLTQQDFAVVDNGKPQVIASFRTVSGGALGVTAHAVILVDAINDTSSGALGRQVKEIEAFFSGGTGPLPYPVSIAMVADGGFAEGEPSRDRSELLGEVQRLTAQTRVVDCATDNSVKSADDAVQGPMVTEMGGQTLDHMEGMEGSGSVGCRHRHLDGSLAALRRVAKELASVAGRAVIVWVGPGWSPQSEKDKADAFSQIVRLTDALRDAQATLDFVSTVDFERQKEFRHVNWNSLEQGTADAKAVNPASLALPVIARQSGGVVFNKSKDLAKDISAALDGADHYYLLEFDPSPTPARGELHSLGLKVNQPGATVSAPSIYYGEQ